MKHKRIPSIIVSLYFTASYNDSSADTAWNHIADQYVANYHQEIFKFHLNTKEISYLNMSSSLSMT